MYNVLLPQKKPKKKRNTSRAKNEREKKRNFRQANIPKIEKKKGKKQLCRVIFRVSQKPEDPSTE